MEIHSYPALAETLHTAALPSGLRVMVLPRKGFTKKLAYHYIKRSQAPFVIAADEINHWNLDIYACNDTLEVKKGSFTVEDPCAGQILYEGCFTAKENASTRIAQLPTFYSEQKILIFKWEANGEKGFNHYLCGYPPISLEMYKKVLENYGL